MTRSHLRSLILLVHTYVPHTLSCFNTCHTLLWTTRELQQWIRFWNFQQNILSYTKIDKGWLFFIVFLWLPHTPSANISRVVVFLKKRSSLHYSFDHFNIVGIYKMYQNIHWLIWWLLIMLQNMHVLTGQCFLLTQNIKHIIQI